MKKAIIYVAATLLVVGIIIFVTDIIRSKNLSFTTQSAPANEDSSPAVDLTPKIVNFPNAPSGDYIDIGTNNGSVRMKNFYKMPVIVDEEFLILKTTGDYQIAYNTSTGEFSVAMLKRPTGIARTEGEKDFLDVLGINQADACKLKVFVGAISGAGSGSENVQSHLSFCIPGV